VPEPRGIDNVFVEVGDLEAAVDWYERVAGVKVKLRTPAMAVLDVGGDVAGVVLTRSEAVVPVTVWFEVEDASAVASELGQAAFPIATGLTVQVADPWGNRIGFTDYTLRPEFARP
jgi:predicted enzyme related to lactoylglutathione lyase